MEETVRLRDVGAAPATRACARGAATLASPTRLEAAMRSVPLPMNAWMGRWWGVVVVPEKAADSSPANTDRARWAATYSGAGTKRARRKRGGQKSWRRAVRAALLWRKGKGGRVCGSHQSRPRWRHRVGVGVWAGWGGVGDGGRVNEKLQRQTTPTTLSLTLSYLLIQ